MMDVSPMNDRGREKLRQVRKLIQKKYAISCEQEKENRIQLTPRTRMKRRIQEASKLSIENVFEKEFQHADQIEKGEFFPMIVMINQDKNNNHHHHHHPQETKPLQEQQKQQQQQSNETFISSIPAPSIAMKPSQLARPTRIKTPKKVLASLKRVRSCMHESSAEKQIPVRKIKQNSHMALGRSSSLDIVSATPAMDEAIQLNSSMVLPRPGTLQSSSSSINSLQRFR